jgi:L-lactate dehydrogenase complex protein LldG
MYDTFKARAEAVSAEVHRVPTRAAAIELIVQRLKRECVAAAPDARAVWADGPTLRGVDTRRLAQEVPGLTFEVTREAAAEARVGVSQMDWAIADTGTLAQDATAAQQRLASTLPWMHIALVDSRRIVPDLASLLARTGPADCNYLSLITGPSRTADIERVLTIGVHGPEKLVVVFVDEGSEAP